MNLADSYAIAFDLLRYARAKEKSMHLRLYVYLANEDAEGVTIDFQAWRAFAAWASEQGPELNRLAREGASDPYRERLSLDDLRAELMGIRVPEEYQEIEKAILDAIDTDGAIGLAVKLEAEDETHEPV